MTEEQRTPGPWIIGEQSGAIFAKNAPPYGNAKFIAETVNRKTALGRANAEYIVMACNCHDDLLAACETAADAIHDILMHGDHQSHQHEALLGATRNLLGIAIIKAGGETCAKNSEKS